MSRLIRFLKLASVLEDNNDIKSLDILCTQFNAFAKKYAHYAPMQGPGDYDFTGEVGNLPWPGSVNEFLKNFPNGLPEWMEMRGKLKDKVFDFKNGVMYNKNKPIESKAHYIPENRENIPNPWRKNLDYAGWENSPYFGSVSEFMKKFPNGIRDWLEWRKKSKNTKKANVDLKNIDYFGGEEISESDREKAFDLIIKNIELYKEMFGISDEEIKDWLESKYGKFSKAHFIDTKKDDVKDFPKEPYIWSGDKSNSFDSILDFLKKYRSQNTNDKVSNKIIEDFIDYWELLKQVEKRRNRSGK